MDESFSVIIAELLLTALTTPPNDKLNILDDGLLESASGVNAK